MKEKLQDIFDCYELALNWKFIDFENKLMSIELKQVDENPFLNGQKKQSLILETCNKYKTQ